MKTVLLGYVIIGVAISGLASIIAGRLRFKDAVVISIAWPSLLLWLLVHRSRGLRPVETLSEFNAMLHDQAQKHEQPMIEMRKRYGHYAPAHLFVPLDVGEPCAICMQSEREGEHLSLAKRR